MTHKSMMGTGYLSEPGSRHSIGEYGSQGQNPSTMGSAVIRANTKAVPKPARNVCPDDRIMGILCDIFSDAPSLKSTCHNFKAVIRPHRRDSVFTVVHHAEFEDLDILGPVPTRIYVTTSQLPGGHSRAGRRNYASDIPLGILRFAYDRSMKAVIRLSTSDFDSESDDGSINRPPTYSEPDGSDSKIDLEICIVPEIEGHQGQLWLAREVRDALASFEQASLEKDGTLGYPGRIKFFVGDDIPACPCCGSKR
jgi:hypothetical protein